MAFRVIRPGDFTWITRAHEPDEPARHVAELSEAAGFAQLFQPLIAFGSFLQTAQFREIVIVPAGEVFPARALGSPVPSGAERARRFPAMLVPVMHTVAARQTANLFGRLLPARVFFIRAGFARHKP